MTYEKLNKKVSREIINFEDSASEVAKKIMGMIARELTSQVSQDALNYNSEGIDANTHALYIIDELLTPG